MKRRYYALGALALAGAAFVLHTLYLAGSFRTIEPHFAGTCRQVPGIIGSEDITIHPRKPVAYLSGYDRRAVLQGGAAQGGLFRYDLNNPAAGPQRLDHSPLADLKPHGISLHVSDSGEETLFVINHGNGRNSLEIFDIIDDRLVHRDSLQSPLLTSPNDLHAVGPRQVYISNDHGTDSHLMQSVEDYLRLPLAGVVFFDGATFAPAAGDIRYANGINQSPDGRTLYVASTTLSGLHVFDRDPASNALTLHKTLAIASGVDNIEMDGDGNLWIGAHPKLLDFVAHAEDSNKLSPSQVIKIIPGADDHYRIEEIYLNAGDELSGSSVAAAQGNRLLIGPVFDARFLDCEMSGSHSYPVLSNRAGHPVPAIGNKASSSKGT